MVMRSSRVVLITTVSMSSALVHHVVSTSGAGVYVYLACHWSTYTGVGVIPLGASTGLVFQVHNVLELARRVEVKYRRI